MSPPKAGPGICAAALTAFAVLVVAARTTQAQPRTEPVRIRFSAPTACPNEETFTREVRGRTARARIAEPNESARGFEVTIAEASLGSSTHRGRLEIRELDGSTSVRQVSGRA